MDSGDDTMIMIKVTAKGGDYSTNAQRQAKTHGGSEANNNGEHTKWQRSKDQKSGYKNGGWSAAQDGKGGNSNAMQDGSNAHSSGWWDPTEAATMPESQGGQQGKGKQRDLLSSLAPWNQGKGMQQQQTMPQASGHEMHQQGMTGPPPSAWQKIPQTVMVMPQSQGGQQQGMAQAAPWQDNNAMQHGQSDMFRAQQAWPNQIYNGNQQMIAETNAHESTATMKPPGAPPGIHVNFDPKSGPATWMIGQWHPAGWNENMQVSSWYLVEKNEPCMWACPDGSPRLATHYHTEMSKNYEYRDQIQNHQGKGGNISENPWAAWTANNEGKGKNQKGKW
jgi:hypothetical protein